MRKKQNPNYASTSTMTNHQILEKAAEIIAEKYVREEGHLITLMQPKVFNFKAIST